MEERPPDLLQAKPELPQPPPLPSPQIPVVATTAPMPASGFRGTGNEGIPTEPGKFYLRALDVSSGELKWEYPMPGPGVMWAGTVSTAGGVVFSGDDDGNLVAVDARTINWP